MFIFSCPNISIASDRDIVPIERLLNSAYRGESSKQGWTTEAHLIGGDTRTVASEVRELIHHPGSVFLKYEGDKNEIVGCVNLQRQESKIYLGMLSVSPRLQGGGIGKKLLRASEEFARQAGIGIIYMTVISVRSELINWYKRHGYEDTGKRKPFHEDPVSGDHLQQLEFMVLEKRVR